MQRQLEVMERELDDLHVKHTTVATDDQRNKASDQSLIGSNHGNNLNGTNDSNLNSTIVLYNENGVRTDGQTIVHSRVVEEKKAAEEEKPDERKPNTTAVIPAAVEGSGWTNGNAGY